MMGHSQMHRLDAEARVNLREPEAEHALQVPGIARRPRCADAEPLRLAIHSDRCEQDRTRADPALEE